MLIGISIHCKLLYIKRVQQQYSAQSFRALTKEWNRTLGHIVRLPKICAGNLLGGMFPVYCSKNTVERLTQIVSGFYRSLFIYLKVRESSVRSSVVWCTTVREGPPYIPEIWWNLIYPKEEDDSIYLSKLEVCEKPTDRSTWETNHKWSTWENHTIPRMYRLQVTKTPTLNDIGTRLLPTQTNCFCGAF